MKLISTIAVCAVTMFNALLAAAVPVSYEGTLQPGTSVTGSVGGFSYFLEDVSSGIDFWRFFATAAAPITLLGTRLNNNLDPAFSLYFGTTSADDSLFSASSNWGGLLFLASADDEVPNPGPGGDPLLRNFIAPFTGQYTVAIGGSLSTDAGQYPYRLGLAVPEPATLPLAGCALFAWVVMRRRTRG